MKIPPVGAQLFHAEECKDRHPEGWAERYREANIRLSEFTGIQCVR